VDGMTISHLTMLTKTSHFLQKNSITILVPKT